MIKLQILLQEHGMCEHADEPTHQHEHVLDFIITCTQSCVYSVFVSGLIIMLLNFVWILANWFTHEN